MMPNDLPPEAHAYQKAWKKNQRALVKKGADRAYLYVHLEADSGEPFYIGMGETEGRPWKKERNKRHKERREKHGMRVAVDDSPWLSRDSANWWEVRWIKAFRDAGYDLTNVSDGGENNPMLSQYVREKQKANVQRGEEHYTKTDAARENLRLKNIGKTYSEETNKKKGRSGPKLTLTEQGRAALKRPKSDLTKQRMRETALRNSATRTDEDRRVQGQKVSEGRKRAKEAREAAAKLSELKD